MHPPRRFAPLLLAAAVHSTFLTLPVAGLAARNGIAPSGATVQSQDLTARAQALFDDQQYEESIQTLSAALLRPMSSRAQKIDVYRLLALNYITLQKKDEAEASVRALLSLEPTYTLPATESPRFRDFFATVRDKWEGEGRPGLVKESAQPAAPVAMQHASPPEAKAGTQIDLTATIDDPQARVTAVKVFFRTGSKGRFSATKAALADGHVTASIPPHAVKPPTLEYYLEGYDAAGLPIVSRGDAAAPFRISVPETRSAWVIPAAIGGSVLAVAGLVIGGLAIGGAFNKSGTEGRPSPGGPQQSTVTVTVSSSGVRW
jgi:tetratricopeptide (TPR) repeat protein